MNASLSQLMHHLQMRTTLRPQKMSNLNKGAMSGVTDDKLALRDTNRESKRRIVQNALQTEDMDQERLLKKVQDRLHRCVGNASLQVVSQALFNCTHLQLAALGLTHVDCVCIALVCVCAAASQRLSGSLRCSCMSLDCYLHAAGLAWKRPLWRCASKS